MRQRAIIDYTLSKINAKFINDNVQFDVKLIEITKENSFKAMKFGLKF